MDQPSAVVLDQLRTALKATEHLRCPRCGLPFAELLPDDYPDWLSVRGPDGVERLQQPPGICSSCPLCTDCCGHDT